MNGAPTTDEQADRLASIAAQLVARVRDDRPSDVGAWLAGELPEPGDWWALAFVLAAAVPLDRPFGHLVAWARLADRERAEVIEQRRAILIGRIVEKVEAAA